jgi:hypothetical protein
MRVEILESRGGERGVRRWWRGRSVRRRVALAGGSVALLLLALVTAYVTRPQPAPPVPTAWPAEHAVVRYDGTLPFGDPTGRTADFLIDVRNQDQSPMTVVQVLFDYRGLTLRTDPRLPVPVPPGQTVRIQLITTATNCSDIPVDDELPFIDVTFRNMRAIGQESEILGDRYTSDLHREMTAACRRG